MSHELTERNGRVEMAYTGSKPWHGLGQELAPGAGIDQWRASAGMDWRIQRAVVRYATARQQGAEGWRTVDDRMVLLRSDTGDALGIVGDGYKVVQPSTVLEFFRDLTESAGYTMETAGTLFGGKKFWALAKTPAAEGCVSDRRDVMRGYVLLCTSADGSMATEVRTTLVRVVCWNTLSASLASAAKAGVRVSHKLAFNPDAAKRQMGLLRDETEDQFAGAMSLFRRLAAQPVVPVQQLELTAELFAPGFAAMETAKKEKVLGSKPVMRVGQLAINGAGRGSSLQGVQGSAWGWLNAVTEYVDHEARARTRDNRLNSAWFGRGDALKSRALEMARLVADGRSSEIAAITAGALLRYYGLEPSLA